MNTRAEKTAATRARILQAVGSLVRDGSFHDASMETIASRAEVTRVTLYRIFGSKHDLLQGLAWNALSQARIDQIDAAHALPAIRDAVRQVLRTNCEMFAQLGESMPLALELARYDLDMGAVINATFHGRRHRSMERLADRVVQEEAARPGWTRSQIADGLLVLTSHEAYETLVNRRDRSTEEAADLLYLMAGAFIAP